MIRHIAIAFALVGVGTRGGAQEAQEVPRAEFRAWAMAMASPLSTVESREDQADLVPLRQIVGNARVVALGEAVHGAHEELALRNRIVRYLVTESGFTAVALETGLSQSRLLHDYVLGRVNATREEISGAFTYGFGRYQENHDLVRWLRDRNAGLAPERRVRLYGIDLAGSYFDNAHRSLEAVFAFLDRADPDRAPSIRAGYTAILGRVDTSAFLKLTDDDRDRVAAKLADLVALIRRGRVRYSAVTSKEDYEWALRQAVVAVQDCSFQRTLPRDFSLGASKQEGYVGWDTAMNQRDASMADNVEWLMGLEGLRGRVLLYAHNYHVQAGEQPAAPEGDGVGAPMKGGFPVGTHLRSMLGRDLVVIGSQVGSFRGWSADSRKSVAESSPGSLRDLAGTTGMPLSILDLRRLPHSGPLRDWMSKVQTEGVFRDRRLVPVQAYDALVYHGSLSPAAAVKSSNSSRSRSEDSSQRDFIMPARRTSEFPRRSLLYPGLLAVLMGTPGCGPEGAGTVKLPESKRNFRQLQKIREEAAAHKVKTAPAPRPRT